MNPYPLFVSQRSPFARRIRLACERIGIKTEEKFMDVFEEPSELIAANPAGMIPVLFTPEFGPLTDSTNILEYLHEKTGAIWPEDFRTRTEVRQASTFCIAGIQASVLYFQEVRMHEVPSARWARDHSSAISGIFDKLSESSRSLWIQNHALTQAGWDLAVALEYISLRLPHLDWKTKNASLVEVLQLARVNSFFSESSPKA